MKYFYITGTSSGIGKALAELLLEDSDNVVVGMSRRQVIQHPRYSHIQVDLSDPAAAARIEFKNCPATQQLVLVNNAGAISETKYVGDLTSDLIISDFNVNLLSPAVLTNNFMRAYRDEQAEKVILNISSGAGKKAVDGWGTYCSSKAGLDMLSNVIALEQKEGFRIFSVAPGIVDTSMQDAIRQSDKSHFSRLNDFVNYKNNNELTSPQLVAKKLVGILYNINENPDTIFSLRDR